MRNPGKVPKFRVFAATEPDIYLMMCGCDRMKQEKMTDVEVLVDPSDRWFCPVCCGTGTLRMMQSARYINGPSVRAEDVVIPCPACDGRGYSIGSFSKNE